MYGWETPLGEIERRKEQARGMGGEQRLTRQRDRGRLNARQRLEHLFDPGTFFEIGSLVGATAEPAVSADALVAGSGRINGRPALAGAEDFTVLGGSIGNGTSDKRYRLCQLARQERVPLVMMLEGAGHRVTAGGAGRRPGDDVVHHAGGVSGNLGPTQSFLGDVLAGTRLHQRRARGEDRGRFRHGHEVAQRRGQ